MNKIDLLKKLNTVKTRSAWGRGVLGYALEIVDTYGDGDVDVTHYDELNEIVNGDEDDEEE